MSLFKPNVEKLRGKGDCDGLVRLLMDRTTQVRREAALALGGLRDSRAVGVLARTLAAGEEEQSRADAARVLGLIRDPRVFDSLMPALHDASALVRAAAADALADLGDARATEALVKACGDSDVTVCRAVYSALGRLCDPARVDALLVALRSDAMPVRRWAADLLCVMADDRALRALTKAAEDPDEQLSRLANHALKRLLSRQPEQPVAVSSNLRHCTI